MINKYKKPYDNVSVYSINEELLFYCSNRKKSWYLKKDLAIEVEPNKLKLKFKHSEKFKLTDPYYRKPFDNKCIICGTVENLTLHHVVPTFFRHHLPEKFKSHMSHDLLPICRKHHDDYEVSANELKSKLIDNYFKSLPYSHELIFLCYTYLFKDKMPKNKKDDLYNKIISINGIFPEDIDKYFPSLSKKELGFLVINSMDDDNLKDFVIMWRKHFIDIMNPKFLPEKWDINHMIES
jgi:hypothetical protein